MLQPRQYRRQESQADELSRRVETDGRGTLTLREPGGNHATVDRIGRRFQGTDRHAQYEQGDEAARETEHDRGNRP
ncbi:hypothetical protein D3C76_1728140 [compost metagenome]